MLRVSSKTVYQRRQEYGMIHTPNGRLFDSELQTVELPALGQTMVWGRLRSMGFCVTHERV